MPTEEAHRAVSQARRRHRRRRSRSHLPRRDPRACRGPGDADRLTHRQRHDVQRRRAVLAHAGPHLRARSRAHHDGRPRRPAARGQLRDLERVPAHRGRLGPERPPRDLPGLPGRGPRALGRRRDHGLDRQRCREGHLPRERRREPRHAPALRQRRARPAGAQRGQPRDVHGHDGRVLDEREPRVVGEPDGDRGRRPRRVGQPPLRRLDDHGDEGHRRQRVLGARAPAPEQLPQPGRLDRERLRADRPSRRVVPRHRGRLRLLPPAGGRGHGHGHRDRGVDAVAPRDHGQRPGDAGREHHGVGHHVRAHLVAAAQRHGRLPDAAVRVPVLRAVAGPV